MFTIYQVSHDNSPPTTINAMTLGTIVDSICNQAERYRVQNIDPNTDERMQVCLERFAQAIQLGIMSRVITGSIPQLLHRLESLPSNALLAMVLQNQKPIYL